MSCEPWCWTAAEVDAHTDAELYLIRRRQAEVVARAAAGSDSPAPDAARSGAMWAYLTGTLGMAPDAAERAMREAAGVP